MTLSTRTARRYAGLYDVHIAPSFGDLKLVDLSPEVIARWQADRVAAAAGRVALLDATQHDQARRAAVRPAVLQMA